MYYMLIAALLPALLLFLYIWKKDAQPEPFRWLFRALLAGVILCIPVAYVEGVVMHWLFPAGNPTTLFGTTVEAFFVAAVPEEAAKLLALWLILRKNPIPKALPRGLKLHIKHFADLSTTELYEILKARFAVFYLEQHIAYQDFDDIDYNAVHLALHRKGRVVAYARLFQGNEPGQWIIGRMLTTERKKGCGKYILEQTILEAERQGANSIVLHAQTQVVSFYEQFGFRTFGDVFMEAGIPHIHMTKSLTN